MKWFLFAAIVLLAIITPAYATQNPCIVTLTDWQAAHLTLGSIARGGINYRPGVEYSYGGYTFIVYINSIVAVNQSTSAAVYFWPTSGGYNYSFITIQDGVLVASVS